MIQNIQTMGLIIDTKLEFLKNKVHDVFSMFELGQSGYLELDEVYNDVYTLFIDLCTWNHAHSVLSNL